MLGTVLFTVQDMQTFDSNWLDLNWLISNEKCVSCLFPVPAIRTLASVWATIQKQSLYSLEQCWLMQTHVVGYKVVDDASEINPLYEPVSGCGTAQRVPPLAELPPYYSSQSRSSHLQHHHGLR